MRKIIIPIMLIVSGPAWACEETAFTTCPVVVPSYKSAPSESVREAVQRRNAIARAQEAQERQERSAAWNAYLDRQERSYEASRLRDAVEAESRRPTRFTVTDERGRTFWGTVE